VRRFIQVRLDNQFARPGLVQAEQQPDPLEMLNILQAVAEFRKYFHPSRGTAG